MSARRIPLKIPETAVECDHESPMVGRYSRDRRIVTTGKALVLDRVDIVAGVRKDGRSTCRNSRRA